MNQPKMPKDDFLSCLASATPEDINRMIAEHGKPPKPWTPIYFFRDPENAKKAMEVQQHERLSG